MQYTFPVTKSLGVFEKCKSPLYIYIYIYVYDHTVELTINIIIVMRF